VRKCEGAVLDLGTKSRPRNANSFVEFTPNFNILLKVCIKFGFWLYFFLNAGSEFTISLNFTYLHIINHPSLVNRSTPFYALPPRKQR